MSFEDYFSDAADIYARCRPCYPAALFGALAALAPARGLAWDCGTGNGQAAVELARHFARVVATDASAEQIAQATPHERIEYRVARAEDVRLEAGSVDLVTVAQAVHWFSFDEFYAQVRQVLAPGGVIAVWAYHQMASEPALDRVVNHFEEDVLAGCWPERIHYIREHYQTLPFPWDELAVPRFTIEERWDLRRLLCYLDSWSATRRYQSSYGRHPIALVWPDLLAAWGDPDRERVLHWNLALRVGRAPGAAAILSSRGE